MDHVKTKFTYQFCSKYSYLVLAVARVEVQFVLLELLRAYLASRVRLMVFRRDCLVCVMIFVFITSIGTSEIFLLLRFLLVGIFVSC